MKIMIIDDEQDICDILSFEIRSLGFEPVSFTSPHKAQEYFSQGKVDLVICDVQMPRMNGLEFFNWMKRENITIPFVILTGEPETDPEDLLKMGVKKIWHKPGDLKNIRHELTAYRKI